jgi:hypothetical protein
MSAEFGLDQPAPLLMQIVQRLAGIEAKQESASQNHADIKAGMTRLEDRLTVIEKMAPAIERMEPLVNDYAKNRNKLSGMFFLLFSLVGALGYFAKEIKAMVFNTMLR